MGIPLLLSTEKKNLIVNEPFSDGQRLIILEGALPILLPYHKHS